MCYNEVDEPPKFSTSHLPPTKMEFLPSGGAPYKLPSPQLSHPKKSGVIEGSEEPPKFQKVKLQCRLEA